MPIHVTDLMPGVRHEIWEGSISPAVVYDSQDQFMAQMAQEQLPFYIVIVEPRPHLKIPPVSVILSSARRYKPGKVIYFVIRSSTFNESVAHVVRRLAPFELALYPDVASATEAARTLLQSRLSQRT